MSFLICCAFCILRKFFSALVITKIFSYIWFSKVSSFLDFYIQASISAISYWYYFFSLYQYLPNCQMQSKFPAVHFVYLSSSISISISQCSSFRCSETAFPAFLQLLLLPFMLLILFPLLHLCSESLFSLLHSFC